MGHFAVQLAKWKGARVIAVASGKNEAFLRDLGADEFIDDTKTTPEDVVRGVDLVIDAVAGPTAGRFLRTLNRGGALFPIFPLGFSGSRRPRCARMGRSSQKSGACLMPGRLASRSTAPIRLPMLARRSNKRRVGISRARSSSLLRENKNSSNHFTSILFWHLWT